MAEFCALAGAAGSFMQIHATGKDKLEDFKNAVRSCGVEPDTCPNLDLREYIYDMPKVMAAADLVICRAGASTLAEIIACGIPAILVPSPNVTNNHQEKNARLLEKAGAAKVILESECTGASLFEAANALLLDAPGRRKMREAQKALAVEDSAYRILEVIDSITLQNHSA
jgi:UDP-N-acetylglucosamine--N-acetylmuramyl-(pentapeptide) pyrophosphoryl-undecaprenol N-acetylglucosamine transferase